MKSKRVFRPTVWSSISSKLTPILLTALIFANIVAGLHYTQRSTRKESLRVLDEGLRKATAKCYAIEGRYPPDLAYLQTHYGVNIDTEKYAVFYEIFSSNVMPNIVIVELN